SGCVGSGDGQVGPGYFCPKVRGDRSVFIIRAGSVKLCRIGRQGDSDIVASPGYRYFVGGCSGGSGDYNGYGVPGNCSTVVDNIQFVFIGACSGQASYGCRGLRSKGCCNGTGTGSCNFSPDITDQFAIGIVGGGAIQGNGGFGCRCVECSA